MVDRLAQPVEARAAIAGSLLESLDDDAPEEQVEALWSAEIARRITEIDEGRVQLVPWSQARQRLS